MTEPALPAVEPRVISFGCRLNAYEAEAMRGLARAAGGGETVLVNTCAVTSEAVRQARQAIRRARRAHPDARILVSGCAAQIDPAAFAAMPEVDRVIGNVEKLTPAAYAPDLPARVLVGDVMTVRETAPQLVEGFDGRARAFVLVQQGCDHRCTFCVIPFGRGNNRSAAAGEIVDQIRALVAAGYPEIVLTGVDITSWGADLPGRPRFGDLVRRILKLVPELRRLRLSSIDPAEIDDALWRALAEEERLAPHLHLSIQAGDDLVLKRMRRRHARADAIAVARRARALRPDVALGADLIAGFPTESAAAFQRTLDLLDEAEIDLVHAFPYSRRPGTPAARMPQVPSAEIKARAAQLRAAAEWRRDRFLAREVGRATDVLVERDGQGRTASYAPVRLDPPPADGAWVRARITGAANGRLVGRPEAA